MRVFNFLTDRIENPVIRSLSSTGSSWFTSATLGYAYDHVESKYTKSMTMKDRAAEDKLNFSHHENLQATGIHTDATAAHYLTSKLLLADPERYALDFGYKDRTQEVTLFQTAQVTLPMAPWGSNVTKTGIVMSVSKGGGSLGIGMSIWDRDFTPHIVTTETSSNRTGRILFEGTSDITLTISVEAGVLAKGISVTINGATRVADANGQVTFDTLPSGTYTVRMFGAGYKEKVGQVSV